MNTKSAVRDNRNRKQISLLAIPVEDRELPSVLSEGTHYHPAQGMSLIEAAAYITGDEFCNKPNSVSPSLAVFARWWNDGMRSDAERDQLLWYAQPLGGTVASESVELARQEMALMWLSGTVLPAWLDLAGFGSFAEDFRNIDDWRQLDRLVTAMGVATRLGLVSKDSKDLKNFAAAVKSASACYAARFVLQDATQGPRSLALDLSWSVGNIVKVCVESSWFECSPPYDHFAYFRDSAAFGVVEPTIQTLQASAHGLFKKMIALKEPS